MQQFLTFITWRLCTAQQHCYHHAPTVKPEAATAVVGAPDDRREDAW